MLALPACAAVGPYVAQANRRAGKLEAVDRATKVVPFRIPCRRRTRLRQDPDRPQSVSHGTRLVLQLPWAQASGEGPGRSAVPGFSSMLVEPPLEGSQSVSLNDGYEIEL
jgi:hypothetical protein